MSVSSFVDSFNKVVISVCSGVVTLDEVKSSCAELKAHPLFRSDFSQLIDLSEASKLDLHYEELNVFAEIHDPFSEKGRRAVVAPNPVSFGVGRMYQMILNSSEFQVFRSSTEAITWLGLNGVTLKGTPSAASVQEENSHATPLSDPSPDRQTRKRFKKGNAGRGEWIIIAMTTIHLLGIRELVWFS